MEFKLSLLFLCYSSDHSKTRYLEFNNDPLHVVKIRTNISFMRRNLWVCGPLFGVKILLYWPHKRPDKLLNFDFWAPCMLFLKELFIILRKRNPLMMFFSLFSKIQSHKKTIKKKTFRYYNYIKSVFKKICLLNLNNLNLWGHHNHLLRLFPLKRDLGFFYARLSTSDVSLLTKPY